MAKEGALRLLTAGEIQLGREVFSETITWHKVWIHHDSYLPLGLKKIKGLQCLLMEKYTFANGTGMIFYWNRLSYSIFLYTKCPMYGSMKEE